jgi:hypothetical protein
VKVTYKPARRARPTEVAQNLRRLVEQTADLVMADYEDVVGNWNTDVRFSVLDESSGGNLLLNVYARGDNADIFNYVDNGTERRYAVMHRDFIPRTSPGSLASGGGGRRSPAYFDYDEINARARGIQAREFGRTIVEERRYAFINGVRAVLSG